MEKWEIVLKGHKKLKKLLQIEAEKLGLTYTEVQVLYHLTQGEKNVTSLAKLVDVNKSTMVEVLDKLDRLGYISRERDAEDRRVVRVKITESGEKILEQVRARYKDLINSLLEKVKDNDKVVEFFKVVMEEECIRRPQVNVKGESE
ncbi:MULTISPECIES: MarR family winged helix-turn-helix transcriptional regulator [unclassified Stygiolobus]|uniref:MarR family winged helix-turn-helix transcriptional regulator n=1 Tax=unclassified Stygiolobus TaxID=2824672 RepID=UPI00307FA710